ncbi:MAG: hypothetical protein CTY20_09150 [Hyphomicrobium sp.]|nr:MAG: hypothetical protein CTY20_09150 [Hyphomicrobium sp.]
MFFAASKIVFFFLQPSSLLALAMGAGLLLAIAGWRARLGLRLASAGFFGFVAVGILPVGNALILPLEQRFAGAPGPGTEGDVAGIILLGGFEDGWVSEGRGGLMVNEAAERLTEGVRLAKLIPGVPVVFTGGSAALMVSLPGAAQPVGRFLTDMGITPERIVLEERSRNTHENALFTRDLVKPASGRRWVLVTSAAHMPRSVGVFRKAGFDVIPYPVDYRTRGPEDLLRPFERIPAGLERTDVAAREWIGLVAYWLTGRTDTLFPGPRN